MRRFLKKVQSYFFAGLIVLLPLAVSIFILLFLFNTLDGILKPLIKEAFGIYIPGLGLISTLILIFIVGAIATNVLGKRILRWLEHLILKIPVVSPIYGFIREITDIFAGVEGKSAFRKVVLLEFPKAGTKSLGFVTNELILPADSKSRRKEKLVSIFVPTNQMYLGHLVCLPEKEIIVLDISVEEGIKMVMSAGIATPDKLIKK